MRSGLEPHSSCGRSEFTELGYVAIRGNAAGKYLRTDDLLYRVVMRFQLRSSDWPGAGGPVVVFKKPVFVFADHDVGVYERAAAEPGRDDNVNMVE